MLLGIPGKRKDFFRGGSFATNNLATNNSFGASYRLQNEWFESFNIGITEPDPFGENLLTEVDLKFRSPWKKDESPERRTPATQEEVAPLEEKALSYFKMPQRLRQAPWQIFDPQKEYFFGAEKTYVDEKGVKWFLAANTKTRGLVDSSNRPLTYSSIRLIVKFPQEQGRYRYFIPTRIPPESLR